MDAAIIDKLYAPFKLKERPGQANQTFKYIPSDDIIDRMNRVFGGNWNTEVIKAEIIEDQVLICVRVYVKDPASSDGNMYYHDGYASQTIARYNYGDKKNQIIDVGNTYKSAMSKAIKTAVAKWGVGLYLEKDRSSNTQESLGAEYPTQPPIATSKPDVNFNNGIPESQPNNKPEVFDGLPPASVTAPATSVTASQVPTSADVPFPPASETSAPTILNDNPLITQDIPFDSKLPETKNSIENVKPDINPPPVLNTPPTDVLDKPAENTVTKLTDVQKIAIEQTLSINNLTFAELAAKALGRTDNLPESPDVLSYSDAVKIIQHGNDIRPVI